MQEREAERQSEERERTVWTKNDVASCICLVPKFDEESVDRFFLHFKKVAGSMEWARDMYCLF